MPVYNKRGILLLPKVIVLNPKDGFSEDNFACLQESGIFVILPQNERLQFFCIYINFFEIVIDFCLLYLSFGVELKK